MYEPRVDALRRRFKRRSATATWAPLGPSLKWGVQGWTSLVPLGTFCTPPRVVPRIFTYLKKLLRYPRGKVRFWVNAQCAHLITRKPLNVRMGKGKGAKVRRYTKGHGQGTLAAVSSLREGLQRRVRRFIGIRLGCPVAIIGPSPALPALPLWARQWRTQARLLRERAREVKNLLKLLRRPTTKRFFARLFRLAWRRPRLRWRGRWPLLPARAGLGRGRRLRIGGSFRAAAVVWAGLASLGGGVRRLRRERVPTLPRLTRQVRYVLGVAQAWLKPQRWVAALRPPHLRGWRFNARALKGRPRPRGRHAVSSLAPSCHGVTALAQLWDTLGVDLARVARLRTSAPELPPRLVAPILGGSRGAAATLLTAGAAQVRGVWRVDPDLGYGDAEPTCGGDIALREVYAGRGGRILTRAPIAPLLLAHVALWPTAGPLCRLVPAPACPEAEGALKVPFLEFTLRP